MQLKYAKTLYLQASAARRASLAEKNLTPEKCIELERIKKVERWVALMNEFEWPKENYSPLRKIWIDRSFGISSDYS